MADIRRTNPKKIKEMLINKGVRHINLITGGVPCQGFSIANRKHNDYDERNFLFLEYMKFVNVFKPDYIILENVSGLRSTAGGQFEKDIKKHMESLGYVVTISMVNAVEYGVPQQRQRLIFVGVKNDCTLTIPFEFPKGDFQTPDTYKTVEMALSDLPFLNNDEQKNSYDLLPQSEYQELLRGEGEIRIAKPLRLNNHIAPNYPPETIKK